MLLARPAVSHSLPPCCRVSSDTHRKHFQPQAQAQPLEVIQWSPDALAQMQQNNGFPRGLATIAPESLTLPGTPGLSHLYSGAQWGHYSRKSPKGTLLDTNPHSHRHPCLLLSQGREVFVFPVSLIYGPLCSLSVCTNSVE